MVVDIYSILNQWQAVGVFDLVLPFLLIFAIIFGILSTTNIIGGNKGVHVVIAAAIGLLSLRLGFVQSFFSEVFPRFGVGLAVLLVTLILVGLFIPKEQTKYWIIGLGILGLIVAGVVVYNSFDNLGYFNSSGWQDQMVWIWLGLAVIAIIAVIVIPSLKTNADGKVTLVPLRTS